MRKGDFDEEMDDLYPLYSRVYGLVWGDIVFSYRWYNTVATPLCEWV